MLKLKGYVCAKIEYGGVWYTVANAAQTQLVELALIELSNLYYVYSHACMLQSLNQW